MLVLSVSWLNHELKRTKLSGQIYANIGSMSPTFVCLLEGEVGKLTHGGSIELSSAGREPLLVTIARAISLATHGQFLAPLDLHQFSTLRFRAHSGQFRVADISVWKSGPDCLGSFSHWHDLIGVDMSPWDIAAYSLWDFSCGSPLPRVEPVIRTPPIYVCDGVVHCKIDDLVYDQRQLFQIHYCLRAPLLVQQPQNACSPEDMDEFLCFSVPGYRHSSARRTFLDDLSNKKAF